MHRLLSLLLLLPFTSFCQEAETAKPNKLSIGFTFSPDYCYRLLIPDTANTSILIADRRDSLEIPKFGYTTGVNLALNFHKRITLETALLFSNKGEKTKSYSTVWVTSSGQPDPSLPTKVAYVYHYLYLDVPVKANFYVLTKKVKLFVSAGLSTNIFLTQRTTAIYEYSDGRTTRNTSAGSDVFKRINFAFTAGVGLGYELTDKLYLQMEPTYRRSIHSIIDAPIQGLLYSTGINFGLYYKL